MSLCNIVIFIIPESSFIHAHIFNVCLYTAMWSSMKFNRGPKEFNPQISSWLYNLQIPRPTIIFSPTYAVWIVIQCWQIFFIILDFIHKELLTFGSNTQTASASRCFWKNSAIRVVCVDYTFNET